MGKLSRALLAAAMLPGMAAPAYAGAGQVAIRCDDGVWQSEDPPTSPDAAAFLEQRASAVDAAAGEHRLTFRPGDPAQALYRATMLCARDALAAGVEPVFTVALSGKLDESVLEPLGAVFTGLLEAQDRARRKFADVRLSLDSEGGSMNVAEALGSGLFSMDLNLTTRVEQGHFCISACVLILAAGRERVVEGRVGIHRMYFEPTPGTGTPDRDEDQVYRGALGTLKDYFEKVGVRPAIVDEMLEYGPNEVHFLSDRELAHYGLIEARP